jgi:hypothetical protein
LYLTTDGNIRGAWDDKKGTFKITLSGKTKSEWKVEFQLPGEESTRKYGDILFEKNTAVTAQLLINYNGAGTGLTVKSAFWVGAEAVKSSGEEEQPQRLPPVAPEQAQRLPPVATEQAQRLPPVDLENLPGESLPETWQPPSAPSPPSLPVTSDDNAYFVPGGNAATVTSGSGGTTIRFVGDDTGTTIRIIGDSK